MGNVEGFEVKIAAIEDSSVIIKMLKQLAQWMKEHDINQWQYLLMVVMMKRSSKL